MKKNNTKKSFLLGKLFFILALSVLISGCKGAKDSTKSVEDVRVGTQGIILNFLPQAPPDKILVAQGADEKLNSFDIILELKNKGAFPQPNEGTAPDGYVVLSGYDPNILTIEAQDGSNKNWQNFGTKTLEGKSSINPNGGQDIMTFKAKVDVDALNVERYEPMFLATACYPYRTVAGPSVCIDPNPYSTVKSKKVCEVQSISLTSQGAPIAVTRVDEEAFTTKTQFKITIKNVGGGDVLKSISDQCTLIDRENIDKVYVSNVAVARKGLECRPFVGSQSVSEQGSSGFNGYVRLVNGEGYIICELLKEHYRSNTEFTTPLTIELNYNYRNSIEKKMQIKKEITSTSGGSEANQIAQLPSFPESTIT